MTDPLTTPRVPLWNEYFGRALALASTAHLRQEDKAGLPYMLHVMDVVARVDTLEEKVVALLHDVVEDTPMRLESLEGRFPRTVIDAVATLTRGPNEGYMDYIYRVANNPLATRVKIADLESNTQFKRWSQAEGDVSGLLKRYARAYNYLTDIP